MKLSTDTGDHVALRRFARNAAGLTNVAAGGLALAAYFLGTMLDVAGTWARLVLAATPFVWAGTSEVLRRDFAGRHGVRAAAPGEGEQQWRGLFTVMAALLGAMVVLVGAVSRADSSFPEGRALPIGVYVLFGLGVPFVVRRFTRTMEEMLVMLFLTAEAALYLVATELALGSGVQIPIVAGVVIIVGVKQHVAFRRLPTRGG